MLRYRHLSQVMLNVSNLARSRDFYSALPGLQPIDEDSTPRSVHFRVGTDRTLLALCAGPSPGLKRFGFEMESQAALDHLARTLDRHGVKWTPLERGFRMTEPHTTVTVDFQCGVPVDDLEPSGPTAAIAGFGHIVLRSPAYREAVAFWRDVLGFRLSDEIDGRISLLRCFPNPLHHSLGIASGERAMFHHLNFRVGDDADLESLARGLRGNKVAIASGPGTHAPSGNQFLYFLDPDGLTLEMSTVAERFEEGSERAPRLLPDRPESFAIGNVRRDARMYTVGEIEESATQSG